MTSGTETDRIAWRRILAVLGTAGAVATIIATNITATGSLTVDDATIPGQLVITDGRVTVNGDESGDPPAVLELSLANDVLGTLGGLRIASDDSNETHVSTPFLDGFVRSAMSLDVGSFRAQSTGDLYLFGDDSAALSSNGILSLTNGHSITLDNTPGEGFLTLAGSGGGTLSLSWEEPVIRVSGNLIGDGQFYGEYFIGRFNPRWLGSDQSIGQGPAVFFSDSVNNESPSTTAETVLGGGVYHDWFGDAAARPLRMTSWGTALANTNNKTVRVGWANGGNNITTIFGACNFNSASDTAWRMTTYTIRTGAAAQSTVVACEGGGTRSFSHVATTLPDSAGLFWALSVQNATTAGDLTVKGMTVEGL